MAKIELTEEQLKLIQKALDFYARVGTGQFTEIKEHPTFVNHLSKEFGSNWDKYHTARRLADQTMAAARNILYNDTSMGINGSWGIYNKKADDSCRKAYDMLQIIRHEFWKRQGDLHQYTVDSSVHLTEPESEKFKVSL